MSKPLYLNSDGTPIGRQGYPPLSHERMEELGFEPVQTGVKEHSAVQGWIVAFKSRELMIYVIHGNVESEIRGDDSRFPDRAIQAHRPEHAARAYMLETGLHDVGATVITPEGVKIYDREEVRDWSK